MLRLTEFLYRTQPTVELLDYYERALWNHMLAVHDPERGMFVYYSTMRPGGYRVYSDEFDSMWCCVGTGLESPGKYGQMIYTRSPDNSILNVNLFIASELKWPQKNLTLRQETQFPAESSSTLTFSTSVETTLTLRIRHPSWIPAGQLVLSVNGTALAVASKPGEFAEIKRPWRNGDKIRITFPMRLTTEPLPHSDKYFALLYGPIVLSGALGTEGLTKYDFWQIANNGNVIRRKSLADPNVPALVWASTDAILARIKPVEGKPLTFRTEGGLMKPCEVNLIPFYQNHFQHYAVYWRKFTPDEYQKQLQQPQTAK